MFKCIGFCFELVEGLLCFMLVLRVVYIIILYYILYIILLYYYYYILLYFIISYIILFSSSVLFFSSPQSFFPSQSISSIYPPFLFLLSYSSILFRSIFLSSSFHLPSFLSPSSYTCRYLHNLIYTTIIILYILIHILYYTLTYYTAHDDTSHTACPSKGVRWRELGQPVSWASHA